MQLCVTNTKDTIPARKENKVGLGAYVVEEGSASVPVSGDEFLCFLVSSSRVVTEWLFYVLALIQASQPHQKLHAYSVPNKPPTEFVPRISTGLIVYA